MAQISTTVSYKRREIPGQMLLDFAAEPAPRAPVEPAPQRAPAPAIEPALPLPCIVEESKTVQAGSPHHKSESSCATLENAPGYKLSGKLLSEKFPSFPNEIERLAESFELAAPPPRSLQFTTDSRALELIEQAAREMRPGEVKAIRVRFFPFRATLYSFKMDKARRAIVKFHVAFRRASEAAILQAARLMLCRSRRVRLTLPREEYDRFVRALPPSEFKLPGARPPKKMSFGSRGNYRQLDDSFQRVNATYFSSTLKQPELCWSPVRARRILGSYQERCDRLIVSRVFDSPNVPLFVLDFLMYHELLHKFLGVGRRGDGKRCMHGPEFKALERKFERYEEAQEFIKQL